MIVFFDDEPKFISLYVTECTEAGWDAVHMGTAEQVLDWCNNLNSDPVGDPNIIVVDIMFTNPTGMAASIPDGLEVGIWLLKQIKGHILEGRLRAVVLTNKRADLVCDSMLINDLDDINVPVFSKVEKPAAVFPSWLEHWLAEV